MLSSKFVQPSRSPACSKAPYHFCQCCSQLDQLDNVSCMVGAQLLSQQSLDCVDKPHTFVARRIDESSCVPSHNAQGIDRDTHICWHCCQAVQASSLHHAYWLLTPWTMDDIPDNS